MSIQASSAITTFIRSQQRTRSFQRGNMICRQDEPFDSVYLLDSGLVKLYDIDQEGNERSINVFGAPAIFPTTWMMQPPATVYYYYYKALTDVSCYAAPVSEVRRFVERHPESLLQLADQLVRANINLVGRIQNLEKSRVGERLEFVLLDLAMRLGRIEGRTARIDAVITQADMADLAGVTRESLSLEINQRLPHRPYSRDNHSTYIHLDTINANDKPIILTNEPQEGEVNNATTL